MNLGLRQARAARMVAACAAGVVALVAVDAQAPAPPSCRTYSAQDVRTLSGAGTGTIEQSCRFDTISFERICTIRSRTHAGPFTLTLTDTYASTADFIDEIRVVPPIARIQRQTRRFDTMPAGNADVTYTYDSDRGQTRLATAVNNNLVVLTYRTWDAAGRPTSAVSTGAPVAMSFKYAYDDARRTMTMTTPRSAEVDTYDADGNMIHEIETTGGAKTTFDIRITKTEKVCR